MGKEITVAGQPALPGFAIDRSVGEVLELFTIEMEFHIPVVSRRPTAVERGILQKRLDEITPVLEPFVLSKERFEIEESDGRRRQIGASELVERSLGLFLSGYASLANADGAGLVTAYKHDLRKLPVFAILGAFDAIKEGRVFDTDGRTGRQIPISRDFPPSSARVYDVAVKEMHHPVMEQIKIQRVLGATKTMVLEISDDERRASIPRVQAMHRQARAALNATPVLSAEAEAAQRKTALDAARERDDRHDRGLIAEWRSLGMEPVYAGERVLSVAVARKVNPAIFVKPERA